MSCRHPKWWNIGGLQTWCPDCGAIRLLKKDIATTSDRIVWAWSRWLKPQGAKQTYEAWDRMQNGGPACPRPIAAAAAAPRGGRSKGSGR